MRVRVLQLIGGGLRRNVLAAFGQALVAMLATFATYRNVIDAVGLEMFGLWSVLMAGAAAARLADVSGGSGLARFVAERLSRNEKDEAVLFVHTVVLAGLALVLSGCALVQVIAPPVLRRFLPDSADAITSLLPVVLVVSVLLPSLSSALCAAIDGTLRTDLRALLMSLSYGVLFFVSLFLLGPMGILGFAAALAAQHLFLVVGAWLVLRSRLPRMGWLPVRWSAMAFRVSFKFGMKVQATAFAGLLSDPLARVLIAAEGGATAAAIYELALRLVQQVRSMFVAAMQPLMPQVAALDHDGAEARNLMVRAQRLAILAGVSYVCVLVVAIPHYSRFILDDAQPDLSLYAVLLAMGYGVNLVSVPLFLVGMGRGVMRWNLAAQFLMAGCIAVAGPATALVMGPAGIVFGQLVGLLSSAAVVAIGNATTLGLAPALRGVLGMCAAGLVAIGLVGLVGLSALS